jgi:hypothetical protein
LFASDAEQHIRERKKILGKHMYSLNVLSLNTVIVTAKWSKVKLSNQIKKIQVKSQP